MGKYVRSDCQLFLHLLWPHFECVEFVFDEEKCLAGYFCARFHIQKLDTIASVIFYPSNKLTKVFCISVTCQKATRTILNDWDGDSQEKQK